MKPKRAPRRKPTKPKAERARPFDVVGIGHRLTVEAMLKLKELTDEKPLTCELEREPTNLFDKNAVKVYVNDDRLKKDFNNVYMHIGYLRKEVAAVLAQGFDRGSLKVKSCRLTQVNTEHAWGRVKVAFLKTPVTKPKISS